MRTLHAILLALLASLAFAGAAQARGGDYVFDGGSARQQAEVRVALEASNFDWSVVPHRIVIHLREGSGTYAKPGAIWIDTDLLTAGTFAWGPIQHEYAHEVDFFLLNDALRARLDRLLGARTWAAAGPLGFHRSGHAALGAERFASTLTWAYWQVPQNSLKPSGAADEAAAMDPVRFRQLLSQLLAAGSPQPPVVTVG